MIVKGTDLQMTRGDSESITVSVKEGDTDYQFQEGDKIYFTVKEMVNFTEFKFQKIVTVFPDNVAVIEILPEDTKKMSFRDHVYDIQLTKANGEVKTIILPSKFTVGSEVTYD